MKAYAFIVLQGAGKKYFNLLTAYLAYAKNENMRKVILIALFLAALSAGRVFAETLIKAQVNKLNLTTDEAVTYKLTIDSDDKNLPAPRLPDFKGFVVLSSSQSSQISFGAKGPKSSLVYTFILVPEGAGKFKIEQAQIKVKNNTYASEPFEIEVNKSSAPAELPSLSNQEKTTL